MSEDVLRDAERRLGLLPKPTEAPLDAEARQARAQLRADVAEARFSVARMAFDLAQTYTPGAAGREQAFALAIERFDSLHEAYPKKLVGLVGRFYQGRCHQELAEYDQALRDYEDLILQPVSKPELRRLVARAYWRRGQCFAELGKIDEGIGELEDWLDDSRSTERELPEWLAVAYQLAELKLSKAASAKDDDEADQLRDDARRLLRSVADRPNQFQKRAAGRLAGVSLNSPSGAEPATFGESFAAGRNALERMNSAALAAELAAENNPEAVDELQQKATSLRNEAIKMLRLALSQAGPGDDPEDVCAARYFLAWLYWEEDRPHEAAVLGEHVATRHPHSQYAARSAKLALAAYEKLQQQAAAAGDADTSFESGRVRELARMIAERWPESPEAAASVTMLGEHGAVRGPGGRRVQAVGPVARGRPGRRELALGSSLWVQHVRSGAPADDPGAAEAGSLLRRGYEGVRRNSEPPTASVIAGALYFAQYLLAKGEADEAVAVLEAPGVGPLEATRTHLGDGTFDALRLEARKLALRAYVMQRPPRREKAIEMMHLLRDSPGGEGLTGAFVTLGVALQKEIEELISRGETSAAREVAATFYEVLTDVADSGDADDWQTRAWIAEASLQLGEVLSPAEAGPYLDKAEEACRQLLAAAEADPSAAPSPVMVLAVRKRLGDCLAAKGSFSEALDQYAGILRQRNSMLDLQQAVAETLQRQGKIQSSVAALEKAIHGARPQADGKNLFWGWLRLAKVAGYAMKKAEAAGNTEQAARYRDAFYHAELSATRARYLASTVTSGAEQQRHLSTARRRLDVMRQLYPDLGGPKWKAEFDKLAKEINNAGG